MTLKRNDFVFRYVLRCIRGKMMIQFQVGHVIEDSPEEQNWVAVWWNKYVGSREVVRKDTIQLWSEQQPDPGVGEYEDRGRQII